MKTLSISDLLNPEVIKRVNQESAKKDHRGFRVLQALEDIEKAYEGDTKGEQKSGHGGINSSTSERDQNEG